MSPDCDPDPMSQLSLGLKPVTELKSICSPPLNINLVGPQLNLLDRRLRVRLALSRCCGFSYFVMRVHILSR